MISIRTAHTTERDKIYRPFEESPLKVRVPYPHLMIVLAVYSECDVVMLISAEIFQRLVLEALYHLIVWKIEPGRAVRMLAYLQSGRIAEILHPDH